MTEKPDAVFTILGLLIDENGDGKISRSEFLHFMKSLYGPSLVLEDDGLDQGHRDMSKQSPLRWTHHGLPLTRATTDQDAVHTHK